jgi:hypothetical protein
MNIEKELEKLKKKEKDRKEKKNTYMRNYFATNEEARVKRNARNLRNYYKNKNAKLDNSKIEERRGEEV